MFSLLFSSRELRALVVEMVLATDMSCHFQQVKAMKNFLQQPEGSVAISFITVYNVRPCPCNLHTHYPRYQPPFTNHLPFTT